MMVGHPISQIHAFYFYLRSILNEYLGESLVQGMPGVWFSCEISRNAADGIYTFERFACLNNDTNIIILVYYDG